MEVAMMPVVGIKVVLVFMEHERVALLGSFEVLRMGITHFVRVVGLRVEVRYVRQCVGGEERRMQACIGAHHRCDACYIRKIHTHKNNECV